jgi:NhaP-type Na+/H+ or K+/H+ antiporter
VYEFAEIEGRVMVLVAFVFIGAGPVYSLFGSDLPWQVWAMAVASLLVIRPIAIALSLIGERLIPSTVVFFGWFGPRGLATAVFLLVAFEEVEVVPEPVVAVTYLTVALSVLLHGITARPLASWCASRVAAAADESMPEMGDAFEHPMR